jgi:hypothetical protein
VNPAAERVVHTRGEPRGDVHDPVRPGECRSVAGRDRQALSVSCVVVVPDQCELIAAPKCAVTNCSAS